ncbi:ABC-2 type transport system permease protein [Xanthomonas arboricola]|uniref:ABC transporter permease n=1 Tax=Xanthomonas cannabis TaxID=1885674 RepID=UPI00161BCE54
MRAVWLVAREELRFMARNRSAAIGVVLLMLLTLAATLTAAHHQRQVTEFRARQQQAAQQAFEAQPDRHPHRVVHYGHFIYRPLPALAAFDAGVDAFTGNSMFLEGHRQNTANFGDVRQSSLLVRFGQLTPAFVLQVLAPLLLVFLGYGAVAREQDAGTLRVLLLQGATRRQLLGGKYLALAAVAGACLLPALVGLIPIALVPGQAGPVALLVLAYAAYLLVWCALVLAVSMLCRRGRDALLVALALWVWLAVLVPRVAPDVASAAYRLPTRLETDVAIQRDLRTLGDSHNPDDPHFAQFKQQMLRRYGVQRVEDLPVNYKGLLALEGERLSASLFERYAARDARIQQDQNLLVRSFAVLSPTVALREVSMALARTDLRAHAHFLAQAERYRYTLVQQLNQLQADAVRMADDTAQDAGADRRKRISAAHWQAIPVFAFVPASNDEVIGAARIPLGLIGAWLLAGLCMLVVAGRRMGVTR